VVCPRSRIGSASRLDEIDLEHVAEEIEDLLDRYEFDRYEIDRPR
jgi:hypothetical protein